METDDQQFESFLKVDYKMPGISECRQIRIEFLGEDGLAVSQARYTDNLEVIQIIKSLLAASNPKYNKSAAVTL